MKPPAWLASSAQAAESSTSPKRASGIFAQNLVARLMHILRPVAHGIDRAGRDRISGDAVRAELACDRFCETMQAGLGGDVRRAMGDVAPKAVEAGDHDDAAPFFRLHQRNGMARK